MAKLYEITISEIQEDGTRKPWLFEGEPVTVQGAGFVCIGLTSTGESVKNHVTMDNVSIEEISTVLAAHKYLSRATRQAAFHLMREGLPKEGDAPCATPSNEEEDEPDAAQ